MSPEPVVPISAIEHHAYCPRQAALIHVDGVWADNAHTVRGTRGHRRVDSGKGRSERGRTVLRAVPLWSEAYGLTGRADAVEIAGDEIVPVEYKIGTRHGDAARLQLCGQALCLEEMTGVPVRAGAIWYSAHRRRDRVVIDERLRASTLAAIEAVRAAFTSPSLPPAVDDRRCTECQLAGHCLPDVVASDHRVERYLANEVLACGS